MTALAIHPLTPDRWDDLVALFGTDSITRMCWCMHTRLPGMELRQHTPDGRRKLFSKVVQKGPPPGLIAYKGKEPVGWVAIAPRSSTPDWNRGRKSSAVETETDATDPAVWGATCFFVRAGHRKKGMTAELLEAATGWAKNHGAARIEACPMSHDVPRSGVGMCVGPLRVFERQGFEKVLERKEGRPLMRLKLGRGKTTTAKTEGNPLPLVGRGAGVGGGSTGKSPASRSRKSPPPQPLLTRGRGAAKKQTPSKGSKR